MNNADYLLPYSMNECPELFDLKAKRRTANLFVITQLLKTQAMLKYNGLPDTIPERLLKKMLQTNGHAFITRVSDIHDPRTAGAENGDLVAFIGGMGGTPDIYYRPTDYIISNPSLNESIHKRIDVDGIIIPNDAYFMGFLPLFAQYGALTSEAIITLRRALINSRASFALSAPDSNTKTTCDEFLNNLENGKISTLADSGGFADEGIKSIQTISAGQAGLITDAIEAIQFLKASALNDIGLNANYNMKREAINTEEAQLNFDALLPAVDDMLKIQNEAFEKVNAKFGTNISVELNSAWKLNHAESVSTQMENPEESEGEENGKETA